MPVTIVIANVSKTGTSYFITDVVPSINLPALNDRIVTDTHTPEAIQGSARIQELFLAGELWIYVDGKKIIGYPILGPQPPPEFIPASDYEDLMSPETVVAETVASTSTTSGAGRVGNLFDGVAPPPPAPSGGNNSLFGGDAPSGSIKLFGDVVGSSDDNQLTLTGVAPGIYTNATLAVDAKGRVVMASNGPPGGGSGATIVWNETPAGVVDGVNDTFALLFPPDVPADLILTKNGIVQKPGAGNDYTISGTSIVFEPGNIPSPGDTLLATYQSSAATLTPMSHETLRQMIHLADSSGPTNGFATGMYREINPPAAVFPTTVTWWDSPAMVNKIIEKTIVYSGVLPTTITWVIYAADGIMVLETAVDTISYSSVFETSRTRAVS